MYGYLLAQARPQQQPAYQLSFGLCPGEASLQDWAFLAGVAKFVAAEWAGYEEVDLDAVPVLGPARVSMLMTIVDNEYRPIFLFPHLLTPMQGLAALHRAIVENKDTFSQELITRRETQQ